MPTSVHDPIRVEEWTMEYGPMLSTLVVEVLPGELVRVSHALVKEFSHLQEVQPESYHQTHDVYHYEDVATALRQKGFTRAEPTE